jgi:hypothetical protein
MLNSAPERERFVHSSLYTVQFPHMRFQNKPSVTVLWHGTLEDSLSGCDWVCQCVHSSMSEARTSASQILLHSMQAPHRNRQRRTEIHQTSHLLPWASNGQHTPAMFHHVFHQCFMVVSGTRSQLHVAAICFTPSLPLFHLWLGPTGQMTKVRKVWNWHVHHFRSQATFQEFG